MNAEIPFIARKTYFAPGSRPLASGRRGSMIMSMPSPDMREYLLALKGQDITTVVTGATNRVVDVRGSTVLVATSSNPAGSPVSLSFIQEVVDRVFAGEEVVFDPQRRSAFVGAVLATMDEVEVLTQPRRARLRKPEVGEGSGWTDDELRAAVGAYLEMLRLELDGTSYIKKQINEGLRAGALSGRSASAVEYRMQNISQVLDELGLPWIRGYRPAKNVGPEVRPKIESLVLDLGDDLVQQLGPTDDPDELARRASELNDTPKPERYQAPEQTQRIAASFKRDPRVVAWVRREAAGHCELCGEPAPFESGGEPFLEVHHVVPLSDGGFDSVENAVAVCPNCHRRLHLSDEGDAPTEELYRTVPRLDPAAIDESREKAVLSE